MSLPDSCCNQPEHLRILIASRAPFFSGAEQSCERLAIGLAKQGHQVIVVLGEHGDAYQHMTDAGVMCKVIPLINTNKWELFKYLSARRALTQLIKSFKPHVVHANDLPSLQILSDVARRFGLPRVCHHRFAYNPKATQWFMKYGTDLNLFVSRAFMEQVCGQSPELIASYRLAIHNAMPAPPIPSAKDRQLACHELNLPVEKTIVTFTGQIIPRKGVADLLNAWAKLDDATRNKAELVIVGDDLPNQGQHLTEMKQLAKTLGINVHFPGYRNDIPRWMVASDIVVLPSHEEPLGLTIMEAMAHQRATIGSRVGGIPEMIEHQQTGLLVDQSQPVQLADALNCLIHNPKLRNKYAACGRNRFEKHFSIDAHVEQIVVQYRQLLQRQVARRCA